MGLLEWRDVIGRKVGMGQNLPVAAFETVILLGGDHHGTRPAVADNGDGLGESEILVPANMALEIAGGHFDNDFAFVVHGNSVIHEITIRHTRFG